MSAENSQSGVQLEFFEVPSPCIGVCESGPRGYCKGCHRSREERLYWLKVDDATRRQIIAACHRRKRQIARRQKNAARKPEDEQQLQSDLFDDPKA